MLKDYSHSCGEREWETYHISERHLAFRSFIYFDYFGHHHVTRISFYHFAHKDKKKRFFMPLYLYPHFTFLVDYFFTDGTYVILNRWNFTSPGWTWNVVPFILIYGTFIVIWWMLWWTAANIVIFQCCFVFSRAVW